MEVRLADRNDLPQLKAVYKKIITHMNEQGIEIWDDIYPCEIFAQDIKNKRLYVLAEHNEIVAAFALCGTNEGEGFVKWEKQEGKAFYLDRLGVNPEYQRKGIGRAVLGKAAALAGVMGAEYLRLFVVDSNTPAIELYRKCGFRQAAGIYYEKIDQDFVLQELGFEMKTNVISQ